MNPRTRKKRKKPPKTCHKCGTPLTWKRQEFGWTPIEEDRCVHTRESCLRQQLRNCGWCIAALRTKIRRLKRKLKR